MLSPDELGRIVIVLVRARNPSNIGAVARAMHDFGLRHLRIVNEFAMPLEGARSAVDASSVLASAVACVSLAEAVADCTLVAGTTAVGARSLDHPLFALKDAAPLLCAELANSNAPGRIALLFGSEKTGLSNEELSHCNWLLTIPMHRDVEGRHLSMNLGQAVAVCLYELVRDRPLANPSPSPASAPAPASSGEVERLTHLLAEVLEATGYTQHHPANSGVADIRRLARRLGLHRDDAPVWMGILRQVLWKLR